MLPSKPVKSSDEGSDDEGMIGQKLKVVFIPEHSPPVVSVRL
jgi:hypothetical protein